MKYANLLNWLLKPKNLWALIFVYTIMAGLFVQLIFLPYIVPSWHAKYGLIKKMDGMKFHRIALELSEKIDQDGWSQWEPTPKGQFVSGIAAICYNLIYPEPWSVLPVNAILNASACMCLYMSLTKLTGSRSTSIIASIPFMLYPSNLLWNTQFHNENYAVPRVVFILYGWVLIIEETKDKNLNGFFERGIGLLFIALGSWLLGLVRNYILSRMTYLFVAVGGCFAVYWLFQKIKIRASLVRLLFVMLSCLLMMFMASVVKSDDLKPGYTSSGTNTKAVKKWSRVAWLPKPIDDQLRELALYRKEFIKEWEHGGSNIDLDVTFTNAADMIVYIPRALQVGFLSPFPDIWFTPSRRDGGTAMRLVSAMEMIVAYFCILGLPMFLWVRRNEPSVWMVTFVCTSMLIVYAMVVPNMGALYRFRYPYFMPLVCFGFAGWMINRRKIMFPWKTRS